ncbi:MAG TPA: hypothetical protein VIJ47_05430 [Acidimicrobiales bacterium]
MYQNVIVPNDGTADARLATAPASDLAWRCGAKVVVVSNTAANDKNSKAAVKLSAIAKSESTVELWVDLENPLPEAALQAAAHREDSLLCLATPRAMVGLPGRRRLTVGQVLPELVARGNDPIMVIGPQVSTAQGLSMNEIVLVLDGTAESDALLDVAAGWATTFGVRLVLTMVPAPGTDLARPEIQQYLDRRAELAESRVGVSAALVGDDGGVDGLLALLHDHVSAVVMMSPGPPDVGLSRLAESVVLGAPNAVVLARRP